MFLIAAVLTLSITRSLAEILTCENVKDISDKLIDEEILGEDSKNYFPRHKFNKEVLSATTLFEKKQGNKIFVTEHRLEDPHTHTDFLWKRKKFGQLIDQKIIYFKIRCFITQDFGYFVYEKPFGFLPLSNLANFVKGNQFKDVILNLLEVFKTYKRKGALFSGEFDYPVYYNFRPDIIFALMDMQKFHANPFLNKASAVKDGKTSILSPTTQGISEDIVNKRHMLAFVSIVLEELLYYPRRQIHEFSLPYHNMINMLKKYQIILREDDKKVTWVMLQKEIKRIDFSPPLQKRSHRYDSRSDSDSK